jgi:hypothetical protein
MQTYSLRSFLCPPRHKSTSMTCQGGQNCRDCRYNHVDYTEFLRAGAHYEFNGCFLAFRTIPANSKYGREHPFEGYASSRKVIRRCHNSANFRMGCSAAASSGCALSQSGATVALPGGPHERRKMPEVLRRKERTEVLRRKERTKVLRRMVFFSWFWNHSAYPEFAASRARLSNECQGCRT